MAIEIPEEDMNGGKRGRQAVRIQSVLDAMQSLKPNKALILDEFGPVQDETERSRIYQSVRAHWADVRKDKPSISFDPETHMVQVKIGKTKKQGGTDLSIERGPAKAGPFLCCHIYVHNYEYNQRHNQIYNQIYNLAGIPPHFWRNCMPANYVSNYIAN